MLKGPKDRNRSLESIITEDIYFDSVGYTYRALAWLDVAKTKNNISAFQYAALEIRLAIENLFFEEIVLCVGTKLDKADYEKCKGNSTKLNKILKRLNPDYKKLVTFTQTIFSVDPKAPPIIIWDHNRLMKQWRKVSDYLHWQGSVDETVNSTKWFEEGIKVVENTALYIWNNLEAGSSGVMMPFKMQPEIEIYWEKFKSGEVDLQTIKQVAIIALPVMKRRIPELP